MRSTRILAALAVSSLLTVLAVAPVAGAELPSAGACDATGRLVCALGSAGASVDCAFVTATAVSCSWSAGYVWAGLSPSGIPGSAHAAASGADELCVSGICTGASSGLGDGSCEWLPFMSCGADALASGEIGPFELAMGDCLKYTVTRAIDVEASAPSLVPPLAGASWSRTDSGADEVCLLDDGR